MSLTQQPETRRETRQSSQEPLLEDYFPSEAFRNGRSNRRPAARPTQRILACAHRTPASKTVPPTLARQPVPTQQAERQDWDIHK